MAENVRDVLRAAQAAELRGDKAQAIALLQQAAMLYRRSGGMARAVLMLRHAHRLDATRTDIAEELERHERLMETPSPARVSQQEDAPDPSRGSGGAEPAPTLSLEAPVEEQPVGPAPSSGRRKPRFIERGPTRADPSLEAWCSFCCRPRAEVGGLVAGPAGAFICAACVGEAGVLLGGVSPKAPPAPRARAEADPEAMALVGQTAALALLERGLALGVRRMLLVGPEGCGKTTWVNLLAREGRGGRTRVGELEQAPLDALLLVEDVERLPPAEQVMLAAFLARAPARTVLLTARGTPAAPSLVLQADQGRLPVLSTARLAEAAHGALPLELLQHVQLLLAFEQPSVEELMEVARRLLALRAGECTLSEEALRVLATEASRSPRAGHELQALLARVPPGSWRLESSGAKRPGGRRRRKGTS